MLRILKEYDDDEDIYYRGSNRSNSLEIADSDFNEDRQFGDGIYFTTSEDTASNYGRVSKFYINTSKGFYKKGDKIDLDKIKELIEYLDSEKLEDILNSYNNDINKLLKSIKNYCDDMPSAIIQVNNDVFRDDFEEFLMCCRASDINGIILPDPYKSGRGESFLVLYNPKLAKLRESNMIRVQKIKEEVDNEVKQSIDNALSSGFYKELPYTIDKEKCKISVGDTVTYNRKNFVIDKIYKAKNTGKTYIYDADYNELKASEVKKAKVDESKLKEGAGAGYSVKMRNFLGNQTISVSDVFVNGFVVKYSFDKFVFDGSAEGYDWSLMEDSRDGQNLSVEFELKYRDFYDIEKEINSALTEKGFDEIEDATLSDLAELVDENYNEDEFKEILSSVMNNLKSTISIREIKFKHSLGWTHVSLPSTIIIDDIDNTEFDIVIDPDVDYTIKSVSFSSEDFAFAVEDAYTDSNDSEE